MRVGEARYRMPLERKLELSVERCCTKSGPLGPEADEVSVGVADGP
jgi:hypothetical protein